MYEVGMYTDALSDKQYFRVRVPSFCRETLQKAQDIALKSGYDPYRPSRMTDQGGAIKWYTFTQEGIKQLFNGRWYYKIYAANDNNGNKVAKVFYMDNTIEFLKDPRIPISCDKFYKSLSGLRKSK